LPFSAFAKGERKYLFYLHNKFVELSALKEDHPEYGKMEYYEIIEAFKKEGFTVFSEIRPKDTDGDKYAYKIKGQVDSLLRKGVKPSDITVLGTSKGGYICWKVSALMKNKQMNFVLVGICSESLLNESPNDNLYGNVLSIYEKSDVLGQTCASFKKRAGDKIVHYKEIELNTNRKHGFLYKALPEWIAPGVKWARGDYK
jgi:dienelactone hydrolase